MKIACLSGKGGAGKTYVAVNLATVWDNCTYIDCDVEEPNGRIFFKPKNLQKTKVNTILPEFDSEKCTGCRKCVEFCKFNALFYVKAKPMVFSDICHSCGGCKLVCKQNAVSEMKYPIGEIEIGNHNNIKVVTGVLDTGEVSGVPIIRNAIKQATKNTVIDCPPGSACSVLESVANCDYSVLVCEPTAFGFHNMKMVFQLVKLLGKPCGIVVNKQTEVYPPIEEFCLENNVEILASIPYEPQIATLISNGAIPTEVLESQREMFNAILQKILQKEGGTA